MSGNTGCRLTRFFGPAAGKTRKIPQFSEFRPCFGHLGMLRRTSVGRLALCLLAPISSDTAGQIKWIGPSVFAARGHYRPHLCNSQDNWINRRNMRSSKNRTRSKGNRNRSVGNIVNRVFDSSGPEGKVRGTPQQIIDKYNQLARDAQLGNDRVAFENFQQHAEHYLRMLAEAQREMDARRDQQQGGQPQGGQQQRPQQGQQDGEAKAQTDASGDGESRSFDEVIDQPGSEDSTLVETPESGSKPRRSRTRRPRKSEEGDGSGATETGDRGKDDAKGDAKGDDGGPPREAAE